MIKIINIKGDKIIIPNNAVILSNRYFMKSENLFICRLNLTKSVARCLVDKMHRETIENRKIQRT